MTDDAEGPDERSPDGGVSSDDTFEPTYGITVPPASDSSVPGWVIRAIILFWLGFLAVAVAGHLWSQLQGLTLLLLISLFLALAIEPGVNRLARRGWRRGSATASIMLGFLL
ncbi:MAG: hypothetical protein RLN74_09405, partial [Ilumatobacter fluminis]